MSILESVQEVAVAGRISADDAEAMAQEAGKGMDELMLTLIASAGTSSLPSLSGFKVGAVAQGVSGALYYGANLEFPTCPVDQAVHAEQAAVVNAYGHGETGISRLAVSAAPCGYCRQFLYELDGAEDLVVLLAGIAPTPLTDFLPQAFGPQDLGVTGGMMGPQDHGLRIDGDVAKGAEAAASAANKSYAPYTESYAGAAIETEDGAIFEGPYLENAAFNPSMSPMQAAVVMAQLSGHAPSTFKEIWVASRRDGKIDHSKTAGMVSKSIAPDCPVHAVALI